VFAIPGVSGQASTATMPVQLQRLYGRHYRTVATGTVRSTGRFTLTATPPKGLNYYRVLFPAGRRSQPLAASSTRPFTIRGT
jgi:hypothetical protein